MVLFSRIVRVVILFVCGLVSMVEAQQDLVDAERAALVALSNALVPKGPDGGDRKGWWEAQFWKAAGNPPQCNPGRPRQWTGVECESGRVVRINLSAEITLGRPRKTILEGEIPWAKLTALDKLTSLDLSGQRVKGEAFPSSTPEMKSLVELKLGNNRLVALTDSVSKFPSLGHLDLGGNTELKGLVPNSMSALTSLTHLDLGNTALGGTWPIVLANLTNLKNLVVANSGLSGPLPESYSSLVKLELVNMSSSKVGGPFPSTWTGFTSLATFDASRCDLTGPFPVLNWTIVKLLNLSHNNLTGPVPNDAWTSKAQIDMSNNYFYGAPPASVNSNIQYGNNCLNTTTQPQNSNETCAPFLPVPPPPSPSPPSSGPNIGLIVGLSVAGGVLLLVLIGLLVWFFMSSRRGDDDDEDYDEDEDGPRDDDDDENGSDQQDDDDDDDDEKRR